jgi:predicted transcriptional regulator
MTRLKTDPSEMISVRLPKSMIAKLDRLAQGQESSRTTVVRGALATYFRFEHGIFVPLSSEHRKKLAALAHARAMPVETLAEEALKSGLENIAHREKHSFSETSSLFLNHVRPKGNFTVGKA